MLIFQAFLLRCDSPWAFPLRSLGGIVWDLQAAVKAKVTVGIAFAPHSFLAPFSHVYWRERKEGHWRLRCARSALILGAAGPVAKSEKC